MRIIHLKIEILKVNSYNYKLYFNYFMSYNALY